MYPAKKIIVPLLIIISSVVIVTISLDLSLYALPSNSLHGWQYINGKTYYFINGSAVNKDSAIEGVRYSFDSNGVCVGKYTGWTRDNKYRYYYSDGIRLTGWQTLNSNTYYFNNDGIMRTGWVAVFSESASYLFDENGVWDGKKHTPSNYKPITLHDFLLDFEYPENASYAAKVGMNGSFKDFSGIKDLNLILAANSDKTLIYGNRPSTDEVDPPENIYSGNNDIYIIRVDEKGNRTGVGLFISKDNNGQCYLYCGVYNFGIKLEDDTAYNTILNSVS